MITFEQMGAETAAGEALCERDRQSPDDLCSNVPISPSKWIKRFLLGGIRSLGGFALSKSSRWRTNRLLVLCYHGLALDDEHLWDPSLFMNLRQFERRMRLLQSRGYSVVPLDQGIRRLNSGDLDSPSVALTFDDGFYSFYKAALPILEGFGYPSTLYLTTYYSDLQEPVFAPAVRYMLWKCSGKRLDLNPIIGQKKSYILKRASPWESASKAICRFAVENRLSALEKSALAVKIAEQLHFDFDGLRRNRRMSLITPGEAAEASRRGVSVELHTHSHQMPLEREPFLQEIDKNSSRIQQMTGRAPIHFCYPNGESDETFIPWLKDRGVISATTCVPGLASRNTEALQIPRLVDVSSLDETEFEGWLCGVATVFPRKKLSED
jgi:peptidoglycan/xylan/chitin deacetylase (PgdA/CDA1 family)